MLRTGAACWLAARRALRSLTSNSTSNGDGKVRTSTESSGDRRGADWKALLIGGALFGAGVLAGSYLGERNNTRGLRAYSLELPSISHARAHPIALSLPKDAPFDLVPPELDVDDALEVSPSEIAHEQRLNGKETTATHHAQQVVDFRYAIRDASAKVLPSVVRLQAGASGGSGFILDDEGTVVTNYHVVQRAHFTNLDIKVILSDGRVLDGHLQNFDANSDIALVKVKNKHPGSLHPVSLGTSKSLRVGEWVIAIGSPIWLSKTVTAGIVSAVGRLDTEIGLEKHSMRYIQTDAPVSEGSSGGPLIDLDGRVVGVTTMLAGSIACLAIPIDKVKWVVHQLQHHGKVMQPYLGFTMVPLNPHMVAELCEHDPKFPSVMTGVMVTEVAHNSPAATTGLHSGMVILQFDGVNISSKDEILDILADLERVIIGRSIPMKVWHNGKEKELTIVPVPTHKKHEHRYWRF